MQNKKTISNSAHSLQGKSLEVKLFSIKSKLKARKLQNHTSSRENLFVMFLNISWIMSHMQVKPPPAPQEHTHTNARMRWVGFFSARTEKNFSQPEPEPTLTRTYIKMKIIFFYTKKAHFNEEQKVSVFSSAKAPPGPPFKSRTI